MKRYHMTDESVDKLATAILSQAAKDYIKALIDKNDREIINCEIFFTGGVSGDDWFEILSNGADPEKVIERAKRKAKEFETEAKRHQPKSLEEYKDKELRQQYSFLCPVCNDGEVRWTSISEKSFGKWIVHKCDCCGVVAKTLWRGENASSK